MSVAEIYEASPAASAASAKAVRVTVVVALTTVRASAKALPVAA
jgi:hypothetical protein